MTAPHQCSVFKLGALACDCGMTKRERELRDVEEAMATGRGRRVPPGPPRAELPRRVEPATYNGGQVAKKATPA